MKKEYKTPTVRYVVYHNQLMAASSVMNPDTEYSADGSVSSNPSTEPLAKESTFPLWEE